MILVFPRDVAKNNSYESYWSIFSEGSNSSANPDSNIISKINLIWNKNHISFYNERTDYEQLNNKKVIYNYIGFGVVSPSKVIMGTPLFSEIRTESSINWGFSIPENSMVPLDGTANIVVTMTKEEGAKNWSQGRYVTYEVIGADGNGTTEQALVRPTVDSPAPTFTISISNAFYQTVVIKITKVGTSKT